MSAGPLTQDIRGRSDSVMHPVDLSDSLCCTRAHLHLRGQAWDRFINESFDRTSQACQSKQEHFYSRQSCKRCEMLSRLGGAVLLSMREVNHQLIELKGTWDCDSMLMMTLFFDMLHILVGGVGDVLTPSQNCWMMQLLLHLFSIVIRSRM